MKQFFFNKTLNFFKEHHIQNKKIVVAVSAGLDSMVLIDLLLELREVCHLKLFVVCIHHGFSKDQKIKQYRDKSLDFVSQYCENKSLIFFSPPTQKEKLTSEAEFRDLRHKHFKLVLKQTQSDLISLAHNQNDLLETRLIHLIRGCGLQGLMAMPQYKAPYLRPLLCFSREEITKYAKANQLKYLEDPSNKDNTYLRNWIRNKWLKDLDKKREGAVKTLAHSLENLSVPVNTDSDLFKPLSSHNTNDDLSKSLESHKTKEFIFITNYTDSQQALPSINRLLFIELSLRDQKRVLAMYMRQLNLSNYGQSHITELLKHNQRTQQKITVKLLNRNWVFTRACITATKETFK